MHDIVELIQDNETVLTRLISLIKNTKERLDISISLDSLSFIMDNDLFSDNFSRWINSYVV